MLQVMLCGAHDVAELSDGFTKVVQQFGAEPWFYQQGTVRHLNSKSASWTDNSRATVRKANLCVFVMLDHYGDITWSDELEEALERGKPFIVLALETSWTRYNTLLRSLSDQKAISATDDRLMVDLLRRITSDHQLTVTPFTYSTFADKLRAELSHIFEAGLDLIESRNRRGVLLEALGGSGQLSRDQERQLVELATDEYEADKIARKTALRRLAEDGRRDDELVRTVCRSTEQGVQRLAFDLLPHLVPLPPDGDLIRELAGVAGRTDDVGVSRRLLLSVARIDPTQLDVALEALGSTEEGVRRRAYESLEENWDTVVASWGGVRLRRFLLRCRARSGSGSSWTERLRRRLDEVAEPGGDQDV